MNNPEISVQDFINTFLKPAFREVVREELQKQKTNSVQPSEDEFLTAKESATFIGDALQTFYGRASRGEIATYGSGKRIFCKRSELQAWKEKNRTHSKEDLNEEIRTRVKNRVKN